MKVRNFSFHTYYYSDEERRCWKMGFQEWNMVNPMSRSKSRYILSSYQSVVETDYRVYLTLFSCVLCYLSHILAGIVFFQAFSEQITHKMVLLDTPRPLSQEPFYSSNAFGSIHDWKANFLTWFWRACQGARGLLCIWCPQYTVK